MKNEFDCIVIGAGVAGMTAAMYLKRANVNVLILENNVPGGQINRTADIENYPGFSHIDGPTLAMNIYSQITELEVPYQYGDVISIEEKDAKKIVKTSTEEYICKAIIIATGRKPRELGLPNETSLVGHGISWCAICDGPFFKGKNVCVVGGGNSAIEESIYLSEVCNHVTLIHRRSQFRADEILVEKLKSKENITIKYNSVINTLNEKNSFLTSIGIDNNGKPEEIKCDGLFIYIGSIPETKFTQSIGLELENEYIKVDQDMRTNIPYIYACGDVIKKEVYQITTAAAEGAIAAMSYKKDKE